MKLSLALNKELPWKEFNISLPALKAAVDVLIPGKCCGLSIATGSVLNVNFDEEITEEQWQLVVDMYADVDEDHAMATDYVAQATIDADTAAKKASGKAKLLALGLSADEVVAMLG